MSHFKTLNVQTLIALLIVSVAAPMLPTAALAQGPRRGPTKIIPPAPQPPANPPVVQPEPPAPPVMPPPSQPVAPPAPVDPMAAFQPALNQAYMNGLVSGRGCEQRFYGAKIEELRQTVGSIGSVMTLSTNMPYYIQKDAAKAMIDYTEMKKNMDIVMAAVLKLVNDRSGATCQ